MFLSNLSIKRPVFATVMMLALLTLGLASYRRLPIDMFPDVEIPVISVVTVYQGASPETVEREVSKRIEEAVNPIAGVRHIGSISREGVSQVWVEFELEVDPDQAAQDARAKVAAIRGELPLALEEPIIEKLDFGAFPVVSLAVRSKVLAPRELTTLVEKKVKRRIENVSGVGKVDLVSPAAREVQVELDPARLEALGLGVDEVVRGLQSENVDTPLGRLNREEVEVPLRVQGKARSAEELRSMVVAERAGRPVALGEVAEVRDGVEEPRSLAFVDGEPAVALDVLKQTGANTVGVVDAVKREAALLGRELPGGVKVELVRDASLFIRESIADVQQTLVLGGLLTVLIVFCFLNSWRSTVITGLTLPISVISSFIAMNFLGMTLNTMTLMALSLAIGLLIDDAIVVRENIVRHLERGQDHFTAAREGTAEIGLAVMATTFSIVAVFVPVAFMKGIVGRFFFQFGITVAFAVLVSLFVSFTLDPMLSSRWVDPDIARTGRRHAVARLLDRFNGWFDRAAEGYRALVGWALDHRAAVLGAASLAFFAGLLVLALLEKEFFPAHDQGEYEVRFKTAPDASIDETRGRLEVVLAGLGTLPEVERTYASIGAGDTSTVRDGAVYVKLVDRARRRRSQGELQRATRERLAAVPGIVPSLAEAGRLDTRKPLLLSLRGEDLPELKRYATRLKDALYGVPGIVDLEMTLEHEVPEYRLVVDRERAADAGLNTAVVAGTLGVLVGGQVVSTFEDEDGDAYDVRLRLPGDLRRDAAQLEDLRLGARPPGGAPALVALGSIASYRRGASPAEVQRADLSREVVVSANLDGIALGTAVEQAKQAAARLEMPPGCRLVVFGETETMEESFGYMAEALVLAVVFVYLILAAQFESFVDPLAIMLSLPLSIVGMAGLLAATGDTINIMSLIGLIMLMGLVTKNAILLVDFAKVLRGRGKDRRSALIEAGRIRLRPIVMTTAAMIFGMLPLALALGAGAEMRAPMARAIVGGLVTSTLLTLIVVPVVYSLLDDFSTWLRARRADGRTATATTAALVLALLAPAPAATEEAAVRALTLEEALAIAAERNRDVQQAEAYRVWVNGKYLEERAAALPRFELAGNLSWLRQVLFTWGQVGAAIRAAREGIGFADDELRRFRQTVARDVSTAFYDVLAARELARIADESLAMRRRHLEEARKKLQMGTATDYDVLAAQVAAENAQPETIRARNRASLARERLRFLLAEEAEVDATGVLPVEIGPYPDYEATLMTALANRPEVAALKHQRGVARELVTIAKAQGKPRLDLSASWGRRWLGVTGAAASGEAWAAGAYLSFPFFDGQKTKGLVEQAKSDLERVTIEEAKRREAIALEVRAAVDAVREGGEIVRALSGTVAQAERVVFMAEKGYELGVKTRLDVEDAQTSLLEAQAGVLRAQREYRVALVALRWVEGTLEPGR